MGKIIKFFIIIILIFNFFFSSHSLFAQEDITEDITISFINPGYSDETFWVMVSDFMSAAANELNIDLEIFYAQRDRHKMISLAEKIAEREEKPDYLITVNEDLVGDEIIKITDQAEIDTFIILNELETEQKEKIGAARGDKPYWLGSLIPNNIDAGYQIANKTIEAAKLKKGNNLEMAAINGSRATPAAVQREEGLIKAIENYDLTLHQILYGNWDQEQAYQITTGLLNRYPNLDLIWTANDPMAIGAIKAIKENGLVPGEDIFIGGLNWDQQALKYVKEDKLVTTVGGHFMTGGWAIILLYDYHHKSKFITESETTKFIHDEIFSSLTSKNIDSYYNYLGDEEWEKIDFREFSKILNSELERYDFSLEKILSQFE